MRSRPAALVLMALLAAAAVLAGGAGCGDDEQVRAAYERGMKREGVTLRAAFRQMNAELGTARGLRATRGAAGRRASVRRIGRAVGVVANALEQMAGRVRALDPPEDIAEPHEDFRRGLVDLAVDLRVVEEAADRGDSRAVDRFSLGFARLPSNERLAGAAATLRREGYRVGF